MIPDRSESVYVNWAYELCNSKPRGLAGGVRVYGLGLGVEGLGFRVWGLGFMVWGLGLRDMLASGLFYFCRRACPIRRFEFDH